MAGYDPLVDALALAAMLHVSPATVRSWAHRGRISRRGRDKRGRTLYSIAEATALVAPTTTTLDPVMAACNTWRE